MTVVELEFNKINSCKKIGDLVWDLITKKIILDYNETLSFKPSIMKTISNLLFQKNFCQSNTSVRPIRQ